MKKNNFLLLFIFSIALYFNALFADWVWDDYSLIVFVPFEKLMKFTTVFLNNMWNVQNMHKVTNYYRPFVTLLNNADRAIYGLSPMGFHFTNILLNAAITILVYAFYKKIFSEKIAFAAVLLFLALPTHVEAVTWISSRSDLLCTLFSMIAMLLFFNKAQTNKVRLLANTAFLIAVLSKETAIMLIPFFIGFDIVFLPTFSLKKIIVKYWFVVVLGLFRVALIPLLMPLVRASGGNLDGYLFTNWTLWFEKFFYTIGTYIRLMFIPYPLALFRHYEITEISIKGLDFISSMIFLAAFIALYVYYLIKHRFRIVLFLSFFLLALFPVMHIFGLPYVTAEHNLYLASVGFIPAIILIFYKKTNEQKLFYILIALTLVFSLMTIRRNTDWYSEKKLITQSLKYYPKSAMANANLGVKYLDKGDYKNAEKYIKKGIKLGYFGPELYENMGYIRYRQEKYNESIAWYKKDFVFDIDYSKAFYMLAIDYELLGDTAISNLWHNKYKTYVGPRFHELELKKMKTTYDFVDTLNKKGDYAHALNLLKILLDSFVPEQEKIPVKFKWCEILYKSGDKSAARDYFTKNIKGLHDERPDYNHYLQIRKNDLHKLIAD